MAKREGETHSPSQEVGRTEEAHKDQEQSKWLQIVINTIDVLTDKVLGVIMYSQGRDKEIADMTFTMLELMQMEYNSMAAKRCKLLREIEQLEQRMDRLADRVELMSDEYLSKEIEL